MEGTVGEQLIHVFRAEQAEGNGVLRPFLLVDLRPLFRYLRRGEREVPAIGEAATELARSADVEQQSDGGGGTLSKLFLLGIVVGLGYALRSRSRSRGGSVDETAQRTAEEAETLADRAANTIQRRGEVAATRIEEGSEALAERIETTGEQTAEQIGEAGERIEDVESEAEERMEDVQEDAEETADEMTEDEE